MLYKPFGKTGISLSTLGFGAMRLPMTEKYGFDIVDYDKAVPVMHRAFELGVNYIDTAPFYCEKDSEIAVGKALKGWRDKVYLSSKNPIEDASGDNWTKRLELSLKKLDTDYIDFYHMWGISLGTFRTKIDVPNGPMQAATKALEQGMIKHLSFSFHDSPKNMRPIVDSGYFESVLCQYNLLDRTLEDEIAHASKKGLGVVIMGPVGGGRLGMPSKEILELLSKDVQSTAEMALRFVLANPNVNMALSGMENIQMVEENAKVASKEGALTTKEIETVKAMFEENKKLAQLYCTGCGYCLPCPQNINIPHVFSLMNYHSVYGLTDFAAKKYADLLTPPQNRIPSIDANKGLNATHCIECGQCEEKCPQHIKIIDQLKQTHETLSR